MLEDGGLAVNFKERGLLIVLSGPSGVGKGTVCRALREEEDNNLQYSVSATTRKPREGEVEGVHYFFKSREEFERMIEQKELLEHAEFVGNYYGTPVEWVRETLESGQDVILEIEVQGAFQVKELLPEAVFLFLAPPSLQELRNRLIGRGTESEEVIKQRLLVAREEIELMDAYDYVVTNDEVDKAIDRIKAIVTAEHCKRERVASLYKKAMMEVI
ncbi:MULTISPECIES: guanylate kinase [Exiguobacterium]|jgi:guanylate kinase|uniref:Guanylate kinase n=1 Tax=Exiguobacterium aestuarii TaxID=273527 RepID=A0ABW2PKZ6_9BACL|nr:MULTISPECIES: guanylate kinase [Exiguobacterium]QPI66684.1 guanylate kinase [Exiguobacterium sp. PBE]MBQ6460330.1 guanylate kinase [Exiguobacterium sp.]MBR2679302.1 guanylate kinase [Exiguobacterium sp.]MCA0979920.1 guanylate kinase [Exiguobacterium aestuarii]MCT4785477.1 guanylate kinase [Exiguobacterium aestuarii]